MTNRYSVEASRIKGHKDIVEHIIELRDRVSDSETSLRIGNTAIEDGNLIVRNGDIIVSESDDSIVLRIMHGELPEIRFTPVGEAVGTRRIALYGLDFSEVEDNQYFIINLELLNGTRDGGYLSIDKNSTLIGHSNIVDADSFLKFNDAIYNDDGENIYPDILTYLGRFYDQASGLDEFGHSFVETGLYAGVINVASGFSSVTHTYDNFGFESTVAPIIGLVNTAGTVSWNLTASSTTSFTVTWSGTLAKTINFWVFRV